MVRGGGGLWLVPARFPHWKTLGINDGVRPCNSLLGGADTLSSEKETRYASTHVAKTMSYDQARKYYSTLRSKGWLTISEEIAKELARDIKR